MNATAETKPRKRAPKPVPAPLGVSDKGRRRFRVTVAEHDEEVARLLNQLWDFDRHAHRLSAALAAAEAQSRTYRTRALWAVGLVPVAGFVGWWLP